jgi:hypothetical protein
MRGGLLTDRCQQVSVTPRSRQGALSFFTATYSPRPRPTSRGYAWCTYDLLVERYRRDEEQWEPITRADLVDALRGASVTIPVELSRSKVDKHDTPPQWELAKSAGILKTARLTGLGIAWGRVVTESSHRNGVDVPTYPVNYYSALFAFDSR